MTMEKVTALGSGSSVALTHPDTPHPDHVGARQASRGAGGYSVDLVVVDEANAGNVLADFDATRDKVTPAWWEQMTDYLRGGSSRRDMFGPTEKPLFEYPKRGLRKAWKRSLRGY